jgi:hypothetical protein
MENQKAVTVTFPLGVACLIEDALSQYIADTKCWNAEQKGVTGEMEKEDSWEKQASEQGVALIRQGLDKYTPQEVQDAWFT